MSIDGKSESDSNPVLPKSIVISALAAILVGAVVGAVVHAVGYNPPDADAKYDWIVARESLREDGNTHADIFELAKAEGVPVRVDFPTGQTESSVAHPRLPGAILLQLPLALVPYSWVFSVSLAMNLALFVLITRICPRIPNRYLQWAVVLGVFVSLPMFLTIRYSSQGALVAALGLGGWLLCRGGFDKAGGALIGLGAVLKLYPLVLLIPLLRSGRGRTSVSSALSTFLVVNLVGLLLPGVSLEGTFVALAEATDVWIDLPANASLVTVFAESTPLLISQALAVACAVVASILLIRQRDDSVSGNPFGWLVIALMTIPLSWASYDMILIPTVFCLIAEGAVARRIGIYVLGAWVVPVLLWPILLFPNGWLVLGVRLGIFAVIAFQPKRIRGFDTWVLPPNVPKLESRL